MPFPLKPGDIAVITEGSGKGTYFKVAALHFGTDRHGNEICRVERVGGNPGVGICISVVKRHLQVGHD